MFNINFAADWIRTRDHLYYMRLLCQLSHNHCPAYRDRSIHIERIFGCVTFAKLGCFVKQKEYFVLLKI